MFSEFPCSCLSSIELFWVDMPTRLLLAVLREETYLNKSHRHGNSFGRGFPYQQCCWNNGISNQCFANKTWRTTTTQSNFHRRLFSFTFAVIRMATMENMEQMFYDLWKRYKKKNKIMLKWTGLLWLEWRHGNVHCDSMSRWESKSLQISLLFGLPCAVELQLW